MKEYRSLLSSVIDYKLKTIFVDTYDLCENYMYLFLFIQKV